jgi:hypothetical protein
MSDGTATATRVDRNTWPFMVQLTLTGQPTRPSAWFCFWLNLAVAVGCAIYGFFDPWWFIGATMIFVAPWHVLAIRWVDKNSRWS